MSNIGKTGPQIRFVENILLEFVIEQKALCLHYLHEDALLAAKIVHTIRYHAKDNINITCNNKPINLKPISSFEEKEQPVTFTTENKVTVTLLLSTADFKNCHETIVVAADSEADAFWKIDEQELAWQHAGY